MCNSLFFFAHGSIIAQERLNRITQFVSEISLSSYSPSPSRSHDQFHGNFDSPDREGSSDWTSSAIPIDSAVVLTAAAAGIINYDEVSSPAKIGESPSRSSGEGSEASDFAPAKEIDEDGTNNVQDSNGRASDASEASGFGRPYESYKNCTTTTSPEATPPSDSGNHKLERSGSFVSLYRWNQYRCLSFYYRGVRYWLALSLIMRLFC